MDYDFNQIIDRKNTNSLKFDFAVERNMPADILPLWVADMDFKTPPAVTQALLNTAQHSIFGYTDTKIDYFNAVRNWFLSGFHFEIQPEWVVKTPGVVFALCMALRALTKESDAVLIQTPVYYPFSESILANNRKLITNALIYKDHRYTINFEDFEQKIIKNHVKLFILCSPHNPVGRVWTQEELIRMGDICIKHNVLIVSDEIHCDFVYEGFKHTIFSSLKSEYLDNSIFCTAPSKTFNLAGLQTANIFIANAVLREKFQQEIRKTGYDQLNTMGLAACQSAYENGRVWADALKRYLTGNLNFMREFLISKLPRIKLVEPQGTYLAWLDFTLLGLSEHALEQFIIHKAGLWLDGGTMFGKEGAGFMRINIACPRATLEKALLQLENAVKNEFGGNNR